MKFEVGDLIIWDYDFQDGPPNDYNDYYFIISSDKDSYLITSNFYDGRSTYIDREEEINFTLVTSIFRKDDNG